MIATGVDVTPAPDMGRGWCRVNHLDCTWSFAARYGENVRCPGCGKKVTLRRKGKK